MNTALTHTTRSTFFTAESGLYRYWLKQGVLKLQVARATLRKFQTSVVGKRLGQYIDMFEVGGGWYEVRPGNTMDLNCVVGFATFTNGLRMWVRALNEFFLAQVNANRSDVAVVYTNRAPIGQVFSAPAAQIVNSAQAPSPNKLAALVARYAHH